MCPRRPPTAAQAVTDDDRAARMPCAAPGSRTLPRSPTVRTRRGIVTVAALLLGWHAVAVWIVRDPLFLAGPLDVAAVFREDPGTGELLTTLRVSFLEVALGMAIGITTGIAFGPLIGASERVSDHADPLICTSYSAPLIALAPLMVLSLGIGLASKVTVVTMVVFFPVLISVAGGVRTTNRTLLEVARAVDAGPWRRSPTDSRTASATPGAKDLVFLAIFDTPNPAAAATGTRAVED